MPWRGYPRRGCKGWVLGGCLPAFQLPQPGGRNCEDGFVCPGVLTLCLCQPSGQWWGLGRRARARTTGRGRAGWGVGWVGEGRSVTLGTSQPPVSGWHLPALGPPKPGLRRGYGFSLRYQRCNHLVYKYFRPTLTHIYMTEVLFCTPSNFPPCVLF